MADNVANKVVLLTGASSGIGAGAAKHFAGVGYRKLAIVARRRDRLEAVAADCGPDCDVLVLVKDVTVREQCEEAVAETVNHFGGEN